MLSFEILSEGIHDPSIFKAIFIIGGPGSGKSTISNMLALRSLGFVPINSDQALEYLMSKHNLSLKMPPEETEKRDVIRQRAKEITATKLQNALDGRLGLIIDGTGENIDKIEKIYNNLTQLGYDSLLVEIFTSLEKAYERNAMRSRSVPNEIVKSKWEGVQANSRRFHEIFDNTIKIDNSGSLADVRQQVNNLYKKITAWSRKPPTSPAAAEWIESNSRQQNEEAVLGHEPKRNPKYLSGTYKVANISPVLGAKPKKQTALMSKFFGGS